VSPTSALTTGGTVVTVTGTGFTGATGVKVLSDTSVQFTAPKPAPGDDSVVVTTEGARAAGSTSRTPRRLRRR
jgi:hypothetical protein